MLRKIIRIDRDRCNGCGACATACHEGAIGMVNGKAELLHEHYCDGLGDCLPACPTNAISFEIREAPAYDEAAVLAARAAKTAPAADKLPCGCPGTQARALRRPHTVSVRRAHTPEPAAVPSELAQWPVQLKLVPETAPYLDNADLLIAADCTAYACGDFHRRFLRGRIALIGCPKLDDGDYAEKLTRLFSGHTIHSVTVVRMQVPCCGGIEQAVRRALAACGRDIPCEVVILSPDGTIQSR